MREGPATVIRREDYAAPAFWIRQVDLTFDLDPVKTIVASRLQIERNADTPAGQPLKLHGEELNLLRILADGESVSFRHEPGCLVIDNPPDKPSFTLEIRNAIAPEKNTTLSGLYTSGGGFFTQCEAEGFRRITYFLDRPDVMAVYTVTIRAGGGARVQRLRRGGARSRHDVEGAVAPMRRHLAAAVARIGGGADRGQQHLERCDAELEAQRAVPVICVEPVVCRLENHACSGEDSFVACTRYLEEDLVLPLELDFLVVYPAGKQHVSIGCNQRLSRKALAGIYRTFSVWTCGCRHLMCFAGG